MARNESQFWYYLKKNTPTIKWTRIENTSSLGTPDLLGYNSNNYFFTLELKVVRSGNKIRLSPHQISFHVKHPKNTFILVEHKDKHLLFEGHQSLALVDSGLSSSLEPVASSLEGSVSFLSSLGG